MLRLLCDRCKKIINPGKDSYYRYRITGGKPIDDAYEVDFCDSCYTEFINWMKEGKENEE